jgi:2-phospho-L-lactate/phosphoenolpyruvate guanylyltransferase
MLMDVLSAIRRVRAIRRVSVVSADRAVAQIARLMGGHFLWEGERRGLNKGVRLAVCDAIRRKFSTALVLPSDIPLVTPREIQRLIRVSNGYQVALVPSKDAGGTNALLLRPPGIIHPSFGKNSFQRHLSIANRKGLSVRVVESARIALDVDEPSDLKSLKRLTLRNETGRYLRGMVTGDINIPLQLE